MLLRLPILLLFANAYLVYKMVVKTGLAKWIVTRLTASCENLLHLLVRLMVTCALLSCFIPNTVTVLIMLPAIVNLCVSDENHNTKHLPTLIGLSVIYGANIGGMGSMVGSPANLLFIGYADYFNIPGRHSVTFLNWFIWSIPLVMLLLGGASCILTLGVRVSGSTIYIRPAMPEEEERVFRRKHAKALTLFLAFILFWSVNGIFSQIMEGYAKQEAAVSSIFTIVYIFMLFSKSPSGKPAILKKRDILTGIPKRGILFLGIVILVMTVTKMAGAENYLGSIRSVEFITAYGAFPAIFFLGFCVIFLTEILGNTMVAAAFFPIAIYLGNEVLLPALVPMLVVSTASTCAFMTPVATPCNALVFGEMKQISIFRMLVMGFFVNLISGAAISTWLYFIIPLVYPDAFSP